ncbi:hypothetical protein DH2020_005278 [Rehmannia glutinosa]|uniref:CCHC-type domain-containing protein n=1 Tax=Rehmannia glutinosa TaxID=99300 RepID=A0ABR0XFM2_REHGL
MDQEIAGRTKRFALTSGEKEEIALEEQDVFRSKAECTRSLIGKIFGTRKVNFTGLRNTMSSIWHTKETFTVREIGMNLFQFVFYSQEDKLKVLKGKTWTFDNQYLILREWSDDALDKIGTMNSVEMWIQIWNVPYHWLSVETGRKIGSKFLSISDIFIPDTGNIKGRHIKILAEVNLEKPLLRGTTIKFGNEAYWIDFRYENLQSFCFYCGLVGHGEKGCRRDKKILEQTN